MEAESAVFMVDLLRMQRPSGLNALHSQACCDGKVKQTFHSLSGWWSAKNLQSLQNILSAIITVLYGKKVKVNVNDVLYYKYGFVRGLLSKSRIVFSELFNYK